MGERQSDGGLHSRRRVHPDDSADGSRATIEPAGLEEYLGAALRAGAVDPAAEQRATDAFRVARDAGSHRARTRRRDDWRPREHRHMWRSVKTTAAMLVAGLTLGGVAVAAIGSVGSSDGRDDRHRQDASAGATDGASRGPSGKLSPSSGTGTHDRPDTAKDTLAHCRAYESVKGSGKALESTAWQRLVTAAGGEANVGAYCAEQLAAQSHEPGNSGNSGNTANPGNTAKSDKPKANTGNTGNAGNSGNTGNTAKPTNVAKPDASPNPGTKKK
ncbi:hypothetical protein [Streptomyces olivochromogenes]|uniref:hypothetical protein n=1 Tax=Streptomyces olivochromogenes TaxID=1963 RepID=UPI001F1836DF|nr:hypothetical protein [Streptomyces olivochromogenes]MCF3133935.1 hypothetical protein [Streptomyces olivochromogenes]